MKKVNFREFGVYTDITRTEKRTVDLSKAIADKLYTEFPGIAAHDLALRIYRSEGEMELSDTDIELLTAFMRQCSGALADSFAEAVKEGDGDETRL